MTEIETNTDADAHIEIERAGDACPMSFSAYVDRVLGEIDVQRITPIEPASSLTEDGGLDSLLVLELIVVTEELAPCARRGTDVGPMTTFDDAYSHYRRGFVPAGAGPEA